MDYLDLINNRNLKSLLKRNYLTEESVREIKNSFFLHPSKHLGADNYEFKFTDSTYGSVFELFTSPEEYNKLYSGEDYVCLPWHFL